MKPGDVIKFGDMPQGTWFKDGGGRVFIKMQNTLPSGIKVVYKSFEIVSIPEGDDARHAVIGRCCTSLHLNAVDQDGIPGSCPDFVPFTIVKPPFKQRVKHGQSL